MEMMSLTSNLNKLMSIWMLHVVELMSYTLIHFETDKDTRQQWFNLFKRSFTWKPELEALAKVNGGILPKAADVYLRTHSKKEPGKGNNWLVPKKASHGSRRAKKGLIPGLGSAGDLYYEKPSSRADKSSNTYTPSLLSQLSARLEQSQQQHESERAEWERQKAEWERERLEEEVRKISEYLVEMQKTMQGYSQMFSQCGGSFPFTHPRDPPDSTGGGAPCAS
ncbi:50S ribosomal protein L9 [Bienertia sinuspersici]